MKAATSKKSRKDRRWFFTVSAAILSIIVYVQIMKVSEILQPHLGWIVNGQGKGRKRRTITLVTGFWAEEEGVPHHAHRIEIEAAILSNLDSPHFNQVVVILDSVTNTANCYHFLQKMQRLRERRSSKATLSCIDRVSGQPNYGEMFQYTLSSVVTGQVIVMSNADQAFDDTVVLAKRIRPNVVLTLSTWGYNTTSIPKELRQRFRSHAGRNDTTDIDGATRDFCFPFINGGHDAVGKPLHYSFSWDTYIYDRETILQSLSTLPSPAFKRQSPSDRNRFVPFFMNQMGADNAALFDLTHGRGFTVWNACKLIRTWHFHLKHTKHKHRHWANDDGHLKNNPRLCYNKEDCSDAFLED